MNDCLLKIKEGVVVGPGDTLVVRVPIQNGRDLNEITDMIYELLPPGAKVILMDARDSQMLVIRTPEDPQ